MLRWIPEAVEERSCTEEVLNYLARKSKKGFGRTSLAELSQALGVSPSTVRRSVDQLLREGRLTVSIISRGRGKRFVYGLPNAP